MRILSVRLILWLRSRGSWRLSKMFPLGVVRIYLRKILFW